MILLPFPDGNPRDRVGNSVNRRVHKGRWVQCVTCKRKGRPSAVLPGAFNVR